MRKNFVEIGAITRVKFLRKTLGRLGFFLEIVYIIST